MSRADREAQARLDGMFYVGMLLERSELKDHPVVREIWKELHWRDNHHQALPFTNEEYNQAVIGIKKHTIDTMLALSMLALHDEFDFSTKRLQRYKDRLMQKADVMMKDLMSWDDVFQILHDECKQNVKIDHLKG
jgi:asparagine synthetase B (glutamine-hydrolysing)